MTHSEYSRNATNSFRNRSYSVQGDLERLGEGISWQFFFFLRALNPAVLTLCFVKCFSERQPRGWEPRAARGFPLFKLISREKKCFQQVNPCCLCPRAPIPSAAAGSSASWQGTKRERLFSHPSWAS